MVRCKERVVGACFFFFFFPFSITNVPGTGEKIKGLVNDVLMSIVTTNEKVVRFVWRKIIFVWSSYYFSLSFLLGREKLKNYK